ncbi:unnamed protein product [Malus baccata var. baccata]
MRIYRLTQSKRKRKLKDPPTLVKIWVWEAQSPLALIKMSVYVFSRPFNKWTTSLENWPFNKEILELRNKKLTPSRAICVQSCGLQSDSIMDS